MKKDLVGLSLMIFSISLMIISGCRKDIEEPVSVIEEKITFNGIVVDQVSGQSVSGAAILLGGLPFGEEGMTLLKIGPSSISGPDGKFSITFLKKYMDNEYIRNSTLYPRLYATKEGYAGSSYPHPREENLRIELYHPAKLILNIWNDTLSNKIDEVEFGILSYAFGSYPGFIGRAVLGVPAKVKCSGKDFNKVFEYYPLWGNIHYSIYFYPINLFLRSAELTLKPDSTLYYSISF